MRPTSGGASTRRTARPFGVDFVHNTWRFGLDRILAGVALSDDSQAWIDTTLPLDDVGSNRVELAGRLAEFVGRLQRVVDALTGTRPLRDWLTALADGIRPARPGSTTTTPGRSARWNGSSTTCWPAPAARDGTALRLAGRRTQLLRRHLAGRPTRANFRTGTLTVCTMVPMRSVPHRVVCLVGLDDTVFPRIGAVDGDDALARDPMTGERDIRSEDRQLLLDAMCAATETLVITYTGANEYTGQQRPPAVPLAELLDALDATTEVSRCAARSPVHHPLQPFDVRNVEPGDAGVPGKPFSFDPTVLRAARGRRSASAATGPRSSPAAARAAARRRRVARRSGGLLQGPGQGLLPGAGLHLPGRRRGCRGRDARRDRRPAGVDRRRPDARRHAARA